MKVSVFSVHLDCIKLGCRAQICSIVVFLGLFQQYRRNGRVLLPLLSTLDKLLTHGYLDELLSVKSGSFVNKLLACLAREAKGCCDVKRLLAIVGVALALLQPHLETVSIVSLAHTSIAIILLPKCKKLNQLLLCSPHKMKRDVLPFIMTMLLNPYPRVRRFTAEQLYIKLAEDGDMLFDKCEGVEEANQLLLSIAWNNEHDPCGQFSDARNRIADLLKISLTEEERNVKIGQRNKSPTVKKDEFESYSSLVNNS